MGVAPPPGLHRISAYSVGLSADPASPVRIGEILSLRLRASAPLTERSICRAPAATWSCSPIA